MKIHLGCGKRNFGEDWIHIDKDNYPHITSHSVTTLPFKDDSCDVIYASHLLEYFDRDEAREVLKEWKRCLMVGGILRVAVPDFEAMCSLYKTGHPLEMFLGPLYGKMGEIPFRQLPIYHKTVYDFHSLELLLRASGFRDIKRYDWRATDHAHVDDHSQAYLPHMDKNHGTLISLNVEAVK